MQFEQLLLFALLVLGAVFMADQLTVDKHLRRGPHLQLDASLKDQLTGLANRRALELHGPQMISQSQEASRAVSVIVTDIDHFKDVNDTHGHLAGDAVLRGVVRNLAAHVRKSDLVARYGGEEFVIILPGSPLAPALRLAERMRNGIESTTVEYDGKLIRVTASFGVVTAFPEDSLSLEQMIEWADSNMYRAKRAGRNRVMTDEVRADS
jgi:diguanylate cyclase (GGDEF)-like protein